MRQVPVFHGSGLSVACRSMAHQQSVFLVSQYAPAVVHVPCIDVSNASMRLLISFTVRRTSSVSVHHTVLVRYQFAWHNSLLAVTCAFISSNLLSSCDITVSTQSISWCGDEMSGACSSLAPVGADVGVKVGAVLSACDDALVAADDDAPDAPPSDDCAMAADMTTLLCVLSVLCVVVMVLVLISTRSATLSHV